MRRQRRPEIEPWDRQSGEGQEAFDAFRLYRELGPERSIQKVAHQVSKNMELLKRWSRKWNWVDRCIAWDTHLDDISQREYEKQYKEMTERHVRLAVAVQGKAAARLQNLKQEEMSPADVIRFITESVKLERLSRGESTDRQEHELTKLDIMIRKLEEEARCVSS